MLTASKITTGSLAVVTACMVGYRLINSADSLTYYHSKFIEEKSIGARIWCAVCGVFTTSIYDLVGYSLIEQNGITPGQVTGVQIGVTLLLSPAIGPETCLVTDELKMRALARKRFEGVLSTAVGEKQMLVDLSNEVPNVDDLIKLQQIPSALRKDAVLGVFLCAISNSPIRIPIFVKVPKRNCYYICDQLVLERALRSDGPINGLVCTRSDLASHRPIDRKSLHTIEDRLLELSKGLIALRGGRIPSQPQGEGIIHVLVRRVFRSLALRTEITEDRLYVLRTHLAGDLSPTGALHNMVLELAQLSQNLRHGGVKLTATVYSLILQTTDGPSELFDRLQTEHPSLATPKLLGN